ncbi:hypothetical protein [Streptomyces sp. NPDC004135]
MLTNTTDDGTADEDVAWDAVAFQPLSAKPKHMVVAMGDSYTSGEGAGSYSPESDRDHGDSDWNACRRSPNAWPRKVTLPGQTKTIGALADSFDPALDFQFTACSGAKTFPAAQGPPRSSCAWPAGCRVAGPLRRVRSAEAVRKRRDQPAVPPGGGLAPSRT